MAKFDRKFRREGEFAEEYGAQNKNNKKKSRVNQREIRRMKREYDEYETYGDSRNIKYAKY